MKTALRVVFSLAIVALLVIPASMPQAGAGDTGRETGRCLRACLSARLICFRQCPITCAQLFPNNIEDRLHCTSTCKTTCLRQESECQVLCVQPPNTRENP